MKMQLLEYENDIVFKENNINVLELETTKSFRNIVKDLFKLEKGEDQTRIRLFESNEEKNCNNKIFCISDYYNLEYNTQKNINTLYKYLFSDEYLEIMPVYSELIKEYNRQLNKVDIDLCYDEINFINLSKALKLRFKFNSDNILENILAIIDIESELKLNQLLVFINIKDYIEIEELQELYKYILYKKVNVLLIESKHSKIEIPFEKKLQIDSDFDEFII